MYNHHMRNKAMLVETLVVAKCAMKLRFSATFVFHMHNKRSSMYILILASWTRKAAIYNRKNNVNKQIEKYMLNIFE